MRRVRLFAGGEGRTVALDNLAHIEPLCFHGDRVRTSDLGPQLSRATGRLPFRRREMHGLQGGLPAKCLRRPRERNP